MYQPQAEHVDRVLKEDLPAFIMLIANLDTLKEASSSLYIASLLIDIEAAISRIKFSPRQKEIYDFVRKEGVTTQTEVGERLGVSQQAVQQNFKAIHTKFKREYFKGEDE